MLRSLLALLVCLSLTSCQGYKFGDISREAKEKGMDLSKKYCKEIDPMAKKILLGLVRNHIPFYPEKGMCGLVDE